MASVVIIYAHPYPNRSRAGRALLASVSGLGSVSVRSLYERYPDFWIDTAAEQAILHEARLIVWQHPVYWYGTPPLLSLWFEKVLARGFAYGKNGTALHGKECLWVPTTGGASETYREGGMHGRAFAEFVPPIEQTARFCGMNWQPPLIFHGSQHASDDDLLEHGRKYRARLSPFTSAAPSPASIGDAGAGA